MRQRKPRIITVLQKLLESSYEFTITDLKHLNGSLLYLDWRTEYPNLPRPQREVCYQGN